MSKKSHNKKRRRELPPVRDEYFNGFNELRKQYKITWDELFERFCNYQEWTEHMFSLPAKVSKTAKLNATTITNLLPEWLNNIYENFIADAARSIPDIRDLKDSMEPKTPAIVIGAGPSLRAFNHLDMLKKSVYYKEKKGIIISTSHALKWCLDAGVIPDYMTLIDGSIRMKEYMKHDSVIEHSHDITGIFSANIHPHVLKLWEGKRHFFLPIMPDQSIPNAQGVLVGLLPDLTEMDACAHDGGFAWNIVRYMGCNPIALIGIDLGFRIETPVRETRYYETFRPSFKTEKEMLDECYRFHEHSFFGVKSYTDFCYDSFMESSVHMFKEYQRVLGVKTINCTGGGVIDDPEIENMWFKDFLRGFE